MNTKTQETYSHIEQDNRLGDVFARQIAFKNPRLIFVATAIVKSALERNGAGVFPDEPSLVAVTKSLAGDDKNVVGTSWRWLGKCGVMARTEKRRKSTTGASKGREIAEWKIADYKLAQTFVTRNDGAYKPPQAELFE